MGANAKAWCLNAREAQCLPQNADIRDLSLLLPLPHREQLSTAPGSTRPGLPTKEHGSFQFLSGYFISQSQLNSFCRQRHKSVNTPDRHLSLTLCECQKESFTVHGSFLWA